MYLAMDCSSLAVTISCLPQMPEHSEMIINTNCLTDLSSSNSAQLVVSSHKIPVLLCRWAHECMFPYTITLWSRLIVECNLTVSSEW